MSEWKLLNDKLRNATEKEAKGMLSTAVAEQFPNWWVHRIYCRYSKMRSIRERKELGVYREG